MPNCPNTDDALSGFLAKKDCCGTINSLEFKQYVLIGLLGIIQALEERQATEEE